MATDALEAGHADLPGMSNEQLLKTCNRLETNRQMMEVPTLASQFKHPTPSSPKHTGLFGSISTAFVGEV